MRLYAGSPSGYVRIERDFYDKLMKTMYAQYGYLSIISIKSKSVLPAEWKFQIPTYLEPAS